jgi:hypothetical protein
MPYRDTDEERDEKALTRKLVGWIFGALLGINAWFVRGLATKIEEVFTDHVTIQQMTKDLSEVKEALRGFQDLRIDVAILKHDVADLKAGSEIKGRKK